VDEDALVDALAAGVIAGAGIDVYETEPPRKAHPLFAMNNVILGSHNLANTDEMNSRSNRSVANAACMLINGRLPPHVINPAVLSHPRLADLRG
jgi:D-3-phosphoglycerate dehydrogenase